MVCAASRAAPKKPKDKPSFDVITPRADVQLQSPLVDGIGTVVTVEYSVWQRTKACAKSTGTAASVLGRGMRSSRSETREAAPVL